MSLFPSTDIPIDVVTDEENIGKIVDKLEKLKTNGQQKSPGKSYTLEPPFRRPAL